MARTRLALTGGMELRIDDAEFVSAMNVMGKKLGLETADIARYQMALWVKDLVRWTHTNPRWSLGEQRRRGEQRIEKDLFKVFAIVRREVFDKWKLDAETANRVDLFRRNQAGEIYRLEKAKLRNFAEAGMRKWHQDHRIKRTGRTWRVNDDEYAFGGRMPVPEPVFKAYLAGIKKMVGLMKAGWGGAAIAFAGRSRIRVASPVPPWVGRHISSGYVQGSWGDTVNGNDITGALEAVNSMRSIKDTEGMMAATARKRVADMQHTMEKRLPRIIKEIQP